MFEKFSAGAIQAINAAREEALRLEFNQVDTDHMLLGLTHEHHGVVARTLRKHRVELKQMRLAVEQLRGRGYSMIRMEDLMFSAETMRALASAAQANPKLVESQDLLCALMSDPDNAAVKVLRHLNLDLEALKQTTRELSGDEDGEPTEEIAAIVPARFNMRLLTPRAQQVLSYAFAATRHFGHTIVGTEQILTGLLYVKESLASQVLKENGVDVLAVEAVASRLIGRGSGTVAGCLSLSRWCEAVLEQAWIEARRLKHTRVGTGHVLLGLTDLDVSGALYLMDHLDINLAQIRYDVENAFRSAEGDPEPLEAYPSEADAEALMGEA